MAYIMVSKFLAKLVLKRLVCENIFLWKNLALLVTFESLLRIILALAVRLVTLRNYIELRVSDQQTLIIHTQLHTLFNKIGSQQTDSLLQTSSHPYERRRSVYFSHSVSQIEVNFICSH